ncbi:13597_t:CDS:2, partial [Acaulospora morrowiae]
EELTEEHDIDKRCTKRFDDDGGIVTHRNSEFPMPQPLMSHDVHKVSTMIVDPFVVVNWEVPRSSRHVVIRSLDTSVTERASFDHTSRKKEIGASQTG